MKTLQLFDFKHTSNSFGLVEAELWLYRCLVEY